MDDNNCDIKNSGQMMVDDNGGDETLILNKNSNNNDNNAIRTNSFDSAMPLLLSSGSSSLSLIKSSNNKSLLIKSGLSDAGSYSLCGLCTALFYKYFPEPLHKNFIEKFIKDFVLYLNLPEKVFLSMNAILQDESSNSNNSYCDDLNSFIKLLYKEMDKNLIKPQQIVEDFIIFSIKDGCYDSRSRVVLIKLANFIGISIEYIELSELSLVEMLSTEFNQMMMDDNSNLDNEDEDEKAQTRKRNKNKKIKRYALIALASIGGGAILGLTGGLSAPLIAAGAAALTSGAAILGTHAGAAIIGSLFGVAGAGLTGYKMNKRVGNIEEFSFEKISDQRSLTITIAISGWIQDESQDAFSKPWKSLAQSLEQYSLRYESCYLLELGRALDYFLSFAISMAAQEALKYTLLSGLMAAISWPATLLTFSSVIDNPWGVCISRSAEVGKFLADVLLSRQQGQRPVTLIGFSLGARVIFFCLEELASRKNSEGIIQDVVLLGAPVSASPERWEKFLPIISGKISNGFCRDDWLLKFLYRTSTATMRIAGLQEVQLKSIKLKNYDLTDLIRGHLDYCKKIDAVLEKIGIRIEKTEDDGVDDNIDVAEEAKEKEEDNQKISNKSDDVTVDDATDSKN